MTDDAGDGGDADGRDDDPAHREPDREEFGHDPVGHAEVAAGMTVGELVAAYGDAGIGAADLHHAVDVAAEMFGDDDASVADLHHAVDVAAEMFGDDDASVFVGLAGAMVPAGMRRVVADLIRDGYVDALVTTGANLTHDAIEAVGGKHHHGSAGPDDHRSGERRDRSRRDHDEQLRDEEVDRIYNVYLPQEHFALFEDHLRSRVFPEVERTVSIQEFVRELGRANRDANRENDVAAGPGVAAAAYEADVPVYCPAIQDSVLGLQAWMYSQTSDFALDALSDMTTITDQAFDAERAGAFVVGGGVPKNFTLQTMLVVPEAYDYAVQLTMDPEHTGGLSGATLEEARSWGKLEKAARNASVYGDATITLPLLVAAVRERLEG